jgi:glyoxylase-like metal-dependent hydrolase (beta-lactamase superfamily II)
MCRRPARNSLMRALTPAFVALVAVGATPGSPHHHPQQPPPGAHNALVQPDKWWDALPRPGYARLERVGEFFAWFQVYRLTADTFAIYEPYQFQEAISYLLVGTERAVLVDTGNGIGDIRGVAAKLTLLPVLVVLTHEHPDHFGGAHAFEHVAAFDLPDAVERIQRGVDHATARGFITGENVWKPLPAGVNPDTWTVAGAKPDRLLHDGDVIDAGARRLEVIHTPGHTPASICLLDRSHRLLFTGDHFYPGPLYLHGTTSNLGAFLRSNDRLASLVGAYDRVLGGHNEPWVEASVIPDVSAAVRTMISGKGDFSENRGLRRYRFNGFDIIVRLEQLTK